MADNNDDRHPTQGLHDSVVEIVIDEENTPTKKTFLGLPAENRLQIYRNVFQHLYLRPINPNDLKDLDDFDPYDNLSTYSDYESDDGPDLPENSLAILLVNQQCHDEAEPVLWQVAVLKFEDWNDGDLLIAKVPVRNLDRVTKLVMPYRLTSKYIPQRLHDFFPNLKKMTLVDLHAFNNMYYGNKFVTLDNKFAHKDFPKTILTDLVAVINEDSPRVVDIFSHGAGYHIRFVVKFLVRSGPSMIGRPYTEITWDATRLQNSSTNLMGSLSLDSYSY